jgi:hypothetical protein
MKRATSTTDVPAGVPSRFATSDATSEGMIACVFSDRSPAREPGSVRRGHAGPSGIIGKPLAVERVAFEHDPAADRRKA